MKYLVNSCKINHQFAFSAVYIGHHVNFHCVFDTKGKFWIELPGLAKESILEDFDVKEN